MRKIDGCIFLSGFVQNGISGAGLHHFKNDAQNFHLQCFREIELRGVRVGRFTILDKATSTRTSTSTGSDNSESIERLHHWTSMRSPQLQEGPMANSSHQYPEY